MNRIVHSAAAATALALLASVSSAHAVVQANIRTYVASNGSGVACSRTAPCATFQAAHDAAAAGGEINCIDAGDFGRLTITKSITIDCAGTLGAITASASGSAAISSTTDGVVVRLRNLTIKAPDAFSSSSGPGISFFNAAALYVENCVIADLRNGMGIQFSAAAGTAKLFVSDTVVRNTAGFFIESIGPASTYAVLDGVRTEKGSGGITASSGAASGSGVASVHVRNSVASGNLQNVLAQNGGTTATTSVTFDHSSATLGAQSGIVTAGARSYVILGRSTVMSNVLGLKNASGGFIFSYQNNQLTGNATDGVPGGLLSVR